MEPKKSVHEMVSLDCEWGKRLAMEFGVETAEKLLEFLRIEGLPIELPAKLVDGLVLAGSPEIRLELLEGNGEPMKAGSQEIARKHRWILSVDGKPQLTLKAFELPKLDYQDTGILTVLLTYYCMGDELCKRSLEDMKKSGSEGSEDGKAAGP